MTRTQAQLTATPLPTAAQAAAPLTRQPPRSAWAAVVVLAAGVRLVYWLTSPSVLRDTVGFIARAAEFTDRTFLQHPVQEPLHPVLIRLAHRLLFPRAFDLGPPDPFAWELAAFTVGMVTSLACLALLYGLGRRLHSPAAGLWAAFFFAVQPYAVIYSVNGLSETTFLAFVLLAVLLTLAADDNRNRWLLAAGAAAMLALLVRKEGIVLLAAIAIYLLLAKPIRPRRRLGQTAAFLAGAGALAALYWLIGGRFLWFGEYLQCFDFRYTIDRFFGPAEGQPNAQASLWISSRYQFFIPLILAWFKQSGFLPVALFLVFALQRRRFPLRPGAILFAIVIVLHLTMVMVQIFGTHRVVSRYMFPPAVMTFPVAGAVLACWLQSLADRTGRPARRFHLSLALILIALLVPEALQRGFSGHRDEIHRTGQWLARNTRADDYLFVEDCRINFYGGRYGATTSIKEMGEHITHARHRGLDRCLFVLRDSEGKNHVLRHLRYRLDQRGDLAAETLASFDGPSGKLSVLRIRPRTPQTP